MQLQSYLLLGSSQVGETTGPKSLTGSDWVTCQILSQAWGPGRSTALTGRGGALVLPWTWSGTSTNTIPPALDRQTWWLPTEECRHCYCEKYKWILRCKTMGVDYIKSYPPDSRLTGDRDHLLYFSGSPTRPSSQITGIQ